ncbi:hypothetical protein [Limnothrix redekei]|uniref:Uncharacterized protein n=1 Tax=Limnothrix redekei LRLZ20PSL1 TaxID=3112953 RepID=A0ABW7C5D4_9CYAN
MNRTTNPLQIWQLATPEDRREFAMGLLVALSLGVGFGFGAENFYVGLLTGLVVMTLQQQQLATTVLLRELGKVRELVDRSSDRAEDGPA